MLSENMPPMVLSARAVAALQAGRKIEAIKILRAETGIGLKEAKEKVEAYVAQNPELQEQFNSQASGGTVGWLFMLIVAIAAIVYFWPV